MIAPHIPDIAVYLGKHIYGAIRYCVLSVENDARKLSTVYISAPSGIIDWIGTIYIPNGR